MTIDLKNYNPSKKLYIGIPFLLYIGCFLITLLPIYKNNINSISLGIVFDLLITIPLIYFLIIRKSNISKLTILRVFLISILLGGIILNSDSNFILNFCKTWISPLVEGTIIFIVIKKLVKKNRLLKLKGEQHIDFLIHCRNIFGQQKTSNIIASEIAMFYYVFFSSKNQNIGKNNVFTSFKENGLIVVLYTLLSILLIEAVVMHFAFSLINNIFAWIITGLSLYTCMQFFAHIRAIKKRLINIKKNSLELFMGLAADAFIEIDNIKSIEYITKDCDDKDAIKIALLGKLESHNMMLKVKKPIEIIKMFGIKKQASTILFFVDQPTEFLKMIHLKLEKTDE